MGTGLIFRPVRNLKKFLNDDDEVVKNTDDVVAKMKILKLDVIAAEDPGSR